jgi:ferric-dicitrate binding protein FerR (iron transport regulator)
MTFASSRSAIATVLLVAQAACYGATRQYDVRRDLATAENRVVHVTLTDGSTVRLSAPRVVLDSLLTGWSLEHNQAVGYPLTSVAKVTGRERSQGRTALLAGGLVVGLAVAIFAFGGGGGSSAPMVDEDD